MEKYLQNAKTRTFQIIIRIYEIISNVTANGAGFYKFSQCQITIFHPNGQLSVTKEPFNLDKNQYVTFFVHKDADSRLVFRGQPNFCTEQAVQVGSSLKR